MKQRACRVAVLALLAVALEGLGPRVAGQSFLVPKTLTEEEQATMAKEPLGSKANPVRCSFPDGEEEYLKRLRCPGGKPPKFKRMGSYGEGPYGTILDGYELNCTKPKRATVVYMDMYHEGFTEKRAVEGFEIVAPQLR